MSDISATRIAEAIAAMKAIDDAWNRDPTCAMPSRLMTDLAIARIDLETAFKPIPMQIKEAA
ncbi:hypothetical protein OKW43_000027 [Paraburkholderia sp. WC7.3g]|uniref:hypothetical protein n=1 Tax=Paraburkholderia sp. WC7.3g TaxID=2991070 RepID=UPI003D216C17